MSGSDAYYGDITSHRIARPLFEAWRGGSVNARAALASLAPPGPIALRCRYRHLIDTVATGAAVEPMELDRWNRVLIVDTFVDDAIRAGSYDRAADICQTLIDQGGFDAVTMTNAYLGLGDVHRLRDELDRAVDAYETAMRTAEPVQYRFGRLRALVPLGHLTLGHHSAVRAVDLFTEAEHLAETLGDTVYLANAIQGRAECAERSGRTDEAISGYERAHELFTEVRTSTGQAHCAQRLGALLHRVGRLDVARDWLVRAARDFEEDGDPVGVINVLEGLGDLLLDLDDIDKAEVQYRAALDLAIQHGFAQAHGTQNLAQLARARGDWPAAERLFSEALELYRQGGDLLGACAALSKLAESRDRLGRPEDALRARVDAVFAIEQYRAANRDAAAQTEYRARFAEIYARALRSAVGIGAAATFAVVADGLAGRRLPGLAEAAIPSGMTDNLTILQHVVVGADQRWAAEVRGTGSPGMRLPAGISRQERLTRLLGNTAIRGAGPGMAKSAVEDLLAAVYLPPSDDGAHLLAALPARCHTLQVVRDPVEPTMLHRLWRDLAGGIRLDRVDLGQSCQHVLTLLQGNSDERSALRPGEIAGLADLLPGGLRQALLDGDDTRLLILPVGELWLVPWGAIPLDGTTLLGQAAEFVVCPSLALQRVLRDRGPAKPADQDTCFWRSPVMRQLDLTGQRRSSGWTIADAARALDAMTRLHDGAHTVIIMCHGRLLDGPGHYLELDPDTWLLPADVLGDAPPARLYLITCWGAGVPGQAMTDPVSIATLTLARGTTEILATVGEFGDTPGGTWFVDLVLESLPSTEVSASMAIHRAVKQVMERPGIWDHALRDWAPLLPIGTFHD